jgi:hypothetical protein
MRNKIALKIVAILFISLMLVSGATPCIAFDNHSTNNASNQFDAVFSSETITANTPFLLSSNTYYVPDDYLKIQWAVDNASAGDTIIARDGTYTENVDVNKDHLTIKSESGAEKTTVQAVELNDLVFVVIADYVEVSGFTVKKEANFLKRYTLNLKVTK